MVSLHVCLHMFVCVVCVCHEIGFVVVHFVSWIGIPVAQLARNWIRTHLNEDSYCHSKTNNARQETKSDMSKVSGTVCINTLYSF